MATSCGNIEATLSSGPYGDARLLRADRDLLYDGIIRAMGRAPVPVTVTLSEDPSPTRAFTRALLDEAITYWNLDRPRVKGAIERLKDLPEGPTLDLAEGMAPRLLLDGPGTTSEAIMDRLHYYMKTRDNIPERAELVPPHENLIQRLKGGVEALYTVAPGLTRSVFPLTSLVAVCTARFTSAYINQTPEVTYLTAGVLRDPLMAGEYLIHESLHEKLATIRLVRPLFPEDYDDSTSPQVSIPWWTPARHYSTARAAATMHVYVHTAAYYHCAIARREHYGLDEQEVTKRRDQATHKARYLLNVFLSAEREATLGPHGPGLVEWMSEALGEVETAVTSPLPAWV